MVAALGVGAAFDDPVGRFFRSAGALMGFAACLIVFSGRPGELPAWLTLTYPLALSASLAVYGLWLGHEFSCGLAAVILLSGLATACYQGYRSLRQVVAGLDTIVAGMTLFALAVLTSLVKGGVLPWKAAGGGGKAPARE